MNKKVFISMLVLAISFLTAMYIFKFFFPTEFVFAIQNENFIKIGNFIDSRIWLSYICYGITAFITYWIYLCACSHRFYLKWYECLYIVATVVINRLVALYIDPGALTTAISMASFLFLPALTKGDIKTSAIVFSVHMLAQAFSLGIRGLPLYLTNANFVTILLMTFECYLWLILFYIIFNYKKKKEIKKYGITMSTTIR